MPQDLSDTPARLAAVERGLERAAAAVQDLEEVLREASAVAGAAMATVNILDADTQHQTATAGFEPAPSPRSESMCAMSLRLGGFVHVPDASADARFASSPWVDGRRADVRFYAAAPLVTPGGQVLGTLCVFDVVAHRLRADQIERLEELA